MEMENKLPAEFQSDLANVEAAIEIADKILVEHGRLSMYFCTVFFSNMVVCFL